MLAKLKAGTTRLEGRINNEYLYSEAANKLSPISQSISSRFIDSRALFSSTLLRSWGMQIKKFRLQFLYSASEISFIASFSNSNSTRYLLTVSQLN